jgi:hypothetical protein
LRSLAASEPLAGTASSFRRWLLVEHAGPWGEVALRDARLPEGLADVLRGWERRTRGRVLLIRRVGRGAAAPTCIAVDTAVAWAGRRAIDRLDDLLGSDLTDPATFPEAVDARIAVVCTHGRRDVCCAELGRPLAAAAIEAWPDGAWESTHVGGDRFAGNLVAFPHGLYFGRVEPERAAEVLTAYQGGRIVLDRYRGRCSDPPPVQAADHAIRTELGLDGIDDVRPVDVQRNGDLRRVRFATRAGEVVAEVVREQGEPIRLTCHAEEAQAPDAWRVTAIEPTPSA